jgi:hypothetical protein
MSTGSFEYGPIEKASISFRIGAPIWLNESRFTELLDLFSRNPGVTDEITLFTSETHPALPIEVIRERGPIMTARMDAARERGYSTGINILSTIGHHEENLPNSLSGDFTPMTDQYGDISRGSLCPNDENLRAYIVELYDIVTKAGPDFIWLDDDIRMWGHKPIVGTCFCDNCVRLMSEKVGRTFTRESLAKALSSGPMDEKLAMRRAFLQRNRDTMNRLFTLIERTVHAITPEMPLGFMTGDSFYEGYDFDTWADVLAGPDGVEVLWRPGGGTYTDERMADITGKAHDVGRQTSQLPDYVRRIQSELESFPYQRLKKSIHSTALEAAAYIASGCTGTAFNVLSMYDEPLDEYHSLVEGLCEVRPFLDLLAKTHGRAHPIGIHSGWVKDHYVASNPEGAWLEEGPSAPGHCNEIWETGLPAAYTDGPAGVTALSGDQVLSLTDGEIRAVLTSGAYLDGPALTRLNAMGYGELTGFEVEDVLHIDCIEEMTDHPLNGDFVGRQRNGRQSFWKCPTHLLRPTAEGTQSLSRVVDYTYDEVHPTCMGVYENAEGGRICVVGYYPWEQLQTLAKSTQLKSVMRWLSHDNLPAYVASFHRANLWVRQCSHEIREPEPGTTAIALLNAHLDRAECVELLVRTGCDLMRITDMSGLETVVHADGVDGPYRRFVIPTIAPWEMCLAVV